MLLRQTLLYLPAQLLGPAALFVAAIVWTHLLSPEDYGALMLIMAVQELIFAFGLSWLSLTVLRYRDALEKGEGAEPFRRAEAGLIYASIAAQILAVIALMPLIGRDTPELVAAAILFIVTRSVLSHLAERLRSGGGVFWYTAAQTAGPVLGFLLALILTRSFGARPALALLGYGIVQALILPIVWVRSGAHVAAGKPTRDLIDPLLRYGLPLLLSAIVTWVSINGIRLVVDMLEGAVALGLMSVGWGLGQRVASTVAMLVTAAAFPMAVRLFNAGDKAGAVDQLARNGVLLVALLAPATAGLILIDDDLVRLMIAEPYWQVTIAILPMAVLSGVARNVRMHYADQVYLLHERTGWLLAFTIVEAVATILACAIGVKLNGVAGAVAGALIAHVAIALAVFAQGTLMLGLTFRWRELARVALATMAMALAVWLMPSGPSVTRVGAAILVGAAVYGAALALLFPDFFRKLRDAVGR